MHHNRKQKGKTLTERMMPGPNANIKYFLFFIFVFTIRAPLYSSSELVLVNCRVHRSESFSAPMMFWLTKHYWNRIRSTCELTHLDVYATSGAVKCTRGWVWTVFFRARCSFWQCITTTNRKKNTLIEMMTPGCRVHIEYVHVLILLVTMRAHYLVRRN